MGCGLLGSECYGKWWRRLIPWRGDEAAGAPTCSRLKADVLGLGVGWQTERSSALRTVQAGNLPRPQPSGSASACRVTQSCTLSVSPEIVAAGANFLPAKETAETRLAQRFSAALSSLRSSCLCGFLGLSFWLRLRRAVPYRRSATCGPSSQSPTASQFRAVCRIAHINAPRPFARRKPATCRRSGDAIFSRLLCLFAAISTLPVWLMGWWSSWAHH